MFFWTLFVGGLLLLWLLKLNKDYHVMSLFAKRVKTTDGSSLDEIAPIPKGNTIFGNTFDILGLDSVQMFIYFRELAKKLRKSFVQYSLGITMYNVITAEDAETVLNDINLITKGIVYTFLEPFIRTGLLTSTDKKWHARRKILTPAFHFNILEQFEEIFKFFLFSNNNNDNILSFLYVIDGTYCFKPNPNGRFISRSFPRQFCFKENPKLPIFAVEIIDNSTVTTKYVNAAYYLLPVVLNIFKHKKIV